MCSVWQVSMQPGKASKQFYKNPTFFSRGLTACTLYLFLFVVPKFLWSFPTIWLEIKGISSLNIFNHATTTTLKKKWGAAATCFFDNSFRSAAGGRAGTLLAFVFFCGTVKEMMLDFVLFFLRFSSKRGRRKSGRISCACNSYSLFVQILGHRVLKNFVPKPRPST